jgi:histidinol-phosphate phosphatase family protein
MTNRRFVILDRDGTIIEERHYISDPDQVELIPDAARSLRQLATMGFGLIVITNQSGIGRGFFDHASLDLVHQRLNRLLEVEGVYLNAIYVCPHTPEADCSCRKPRPGLLERAVKELNFDPRFGFFIGDRPGDIELGQQFGATTFLVRTGYGARVAGEGTAKPDYIVEGLWEAAQIIGNLFASTSV